MATLGARGLRQDSKGSASPYRRLVWKSSGSLRNLGKGGRGRPEAAGNSVHLLAKNYVFIKLPYFPGYQTILLSKIFRLKIEVRLIHRSKVRKEQKQVEGKAGIKAILQHFDPFPPTLANPQIS